jgi:prolyl oligopeptidase
MTRLVIKTVWCLLRTEWLMRTRGLPALHKILKRERPAQIRRKRYSEEQVCRAVKIACLIYFKPLLCLQRSAVTTIILRRHGLPAELVIGAQVLPFKSHAWVELDGRVVGDNAYVSRLYRELERC